MRRFLPLLAGFFAVVLPVAALENGCHAGTNTVVPYAAGIFTSDIEENGTGFFRVMRRSDGRWWTIDPLGRGVVLLGVDHVKYQGFWSARTTRMRYLETNRRKFPNKSDWETNTLARLKSWGFNMLGGGCDPALERRNLAHCRSIRLSNALCLGKVSPERSICPHEGSPCTMFPNVFHPDFEALCNDVARKECAPNRNDAWLVGYFIDNELAWWGRGALDSGLFDAVAKLPSGHSAKVAQARFLAARGISGECPVAVKVDFLRLAAERYFSIATSAIRRADPNHLILGARFAGVNGAHPVVWEISGKYCDVVTLNCYPWADLDRNEMRMTRKLDSARVADVFSELHARTGRPLLVTEWSFPALDSGLPCKHGAGQRFRTQELRVKASELFAKTMLALPFMLGYNYFMWVDQPPEGLSDAFPEDSNYGLVRENGEAYGGLTSMFARLHHDVARWRNAGIPSTKDPPPRVGASADRARSALAVVGGCVRDGDRYCVTNNAGLSLEGRVGGPSIFENVSLSGVSLGRFTGMLCDQVDGKSRWRNLSRVTAAEWHNGSLIATGEGGDARSRFSFRFSISPVANQPWFLCELIEINNLGTVPMAISAVLFRQLAPYAADKVGEETFRGTPNLWQVPMADAWFRKADGAYFGGWSCAPSVAGFDYYMSADKRLQHPDAKFVPPTRGVIAPGDKCVLAGTVWMLSICGITGGRAAWDGTVERLENLAGGWGRVCDDLVVDGWNYTNR